jgi:hypothetical protein
MTPAAKIKSNQFSPPPPLGAVTVSVADDAAVLLAFCAVVSALAGRVLV